MPAERYAPLFDAMSSMDVACALASVRAVGAMLRAPQMPPVELPTEPLLSPTDEELEQEATVIMPDRLAPH